MKKSNYSGFYKLSVEERLDEVVKFANLDKEDIENIKNTDALDISKADNMVENVIGRFTLPMGVALNFKINDKDYIIPMVSEEASVIAAASNAAKLARSSGGFYTSNTGSIMIAQIQIVGVKDVNYTRMVIYENKERILKICNDKDPVLVKFGGGALDIDVRVIETNFENMVILHLKVNTLDAMGANAVNTMAEAVAPFIETITGGTVYLRILSNLAIERLVRARTKIKKEELGGEEVVDKIILAYTFAEADPFRATTHNKGIMNGISAVVLATGNDTRAIEAGAHAYASITGSYKPLTKWEKDNNGDLVGTIELPLALGLVGGATKIHPTAKTVVKILGVKSATELGEIVASVGLAQNLAAIKALATEGIQRGHMSLHAKNIASVAGAKGEELDRIVKKMIEDKNINLEYAKSLLKNKE
ncbi:hydroxymethylglutaryl-CoA reductase, degradative [Fusobacterium polymorphum]|jgi:hydroxymethylglutaryl-coA reductase, degradative|uniref:3-hydroxy-3-methylglutaryl coenzyme A reductase n=1 Tax=Fusobacterium nucleatum subsp. polymorphum TaxID=76857 RepID=A0A2C6AYE0_FUSNP|nr:hydroxymethylglutaryl-CoA reductase, degradative [Fusobacterium polymorphum]PHH99235.1 hydroxymethylglutaryl-CoA reductase, degradative [Fusobacterium polymorphum]PHI10532.1 hydroxymethylglutaryl-CoA reductase, degradative [Fusobacterium polymorphum]PIM75936.1 hydroxymethylglutaryl-CoA reductase, degradative [Fusobacterium polymorphum]